MSEHDQSRSTALDIRPIDTVQVFRTQHHAGLSPRAPNIISTIFAPVTANAVMVYGVCSKLPHLCETQWGIALGSSLSLAAFAIYDHWYYGRRERANDLQESINSVKKSNHDINMLKYQEEKAKNEVAIQAWDLFDKEQNARKRTWQYTWKPKFESYKTIATNPAMASLIEKAEDLMDKTIKAEDDFIENKKRAVTLQQLTDGEEGVLHWTALLKLEQEAEEAVTALEKALQEASAAFQNSWLDVKKANDDTISANSQSRRSVARRMLEYNKPRLLIETNTNCDAQYCHRIWHMPSTPDLRTKRNIGDTESDVIHNIYFTPLNYGFDEHHLLQRRLPPVWDDNYNEDFVEDCTDTADLDGREIPIRIAAMWGGDFESLESIAKLGKANILDLRKALSKDTNLIMLGTGDWACLNTDYDHEGKPATRAAVIVTDDEEKLHENATPILEKCKGILADE
ncbi:hypothetical protein N7510_002320 [Penicillium lagena]|uniref:uncharacterized protein n=1 Tax=Penicillium lagena TaxID=94218 RepID=UPI00254186AD|nr:uncharacterized protein N7510_002320 [Penicillium lagena]KAJ5626011.1 hypothetical protein N7510_002320 [Penicillium lagena]